jgi:hypothetical protein
MSDGTCDQLYLALRLALLETHLDGREPLPLIVDDILIMFDDARAAQPSQALAACPERRKSSSSPTTTTWSGWRRRRSPKTPCSFIRWRRARS